MDKFFAIESLVFEKKDKATNTVKNKKHEQFTKTECKVLKIYQRQLKTLNGVNIINIVR